MSATLPSLLTRKKISVCGVVQGVGFRPFVYNLAQTLCLSGYVLNSSSGVIIEIEGEDESLQAFLQSLRSNAPPLAVIEEVTVVEEQPHGDSGFAILESRDTFGDFVLISPDVATCEDCWREFNDPQNRRFSYPFTNCTNCGPRYTIVNDIPYDRPRTTMSSFGMCELCQSEYDDPRDRRFHAQPNACAVCGPALALLDTNGSGQPEFDSARQVEILRQARDLLRAGKILAVKGLGGFFLACDAGNDDSVRTLRRRKRRSDKPFALMARDLKAVQEFCEVSESDGVALRSLRRPIVILPRRAGNLMSAEVAPGNKTLGVMLPYTPLHHLLFGESSLHSCEFPALVMTSGNISEEPIVVSNEEALERLRPIADGFLLHNRGIHMRVDDSVVRTFHGCEQVLRRSRGYAPQPVDLGFSVNEILACGAELKNTFCLTKGRYAILSQHIGDFENFETLQFFRETLENLKKLFRVEPKAVAYDLHPRYMSSRFAQSLPIERKFAIQHHHAHIASCMAENHLRQRVIGVAFDGTGYGTDGQIWGGEFLAADFAGFKRLAHLRYIPLPGGDAAVREPWRAALSYLKETFGASPWPPEAAFLNCVPEKRVALVDAMLNRGINTVQTSSCGRLFDAVASLIDVRHEVTFEGQAAIELEAIADNSVTEEYPFCVKESDCDGSSQVDLRPMILAVMQDIKRSKPGSYISACFHNTMARVVVDVCRGIRERENLNGVCLSGGTFQNHYLLDRAVTGLRATGFEVYLHATVPANDGGISLGQAVIANEILRNGDLNVPGDSR